MTRLISQSIDSPLPLRTRLVMRLHFLFCLWCRRYRDQLDFLRKAAKLSSENDRGTGQKKLTPEARERLKASLRSQD